MITGKPIVINGRVGLGKLLASIIPNETAPLQPHVPYTRKESRNWGPTIVGCFVFPILIGLSGVFMLQLTLGLGLPVAVPIALTFLIVSLAIYKLGHCNFYDIMGLKETEMTITTEYVQWIYRRPLSKDEVRTIPLSEYLGLRFEVHEEFRAYPNHYNQQLFYVTLVHPVRQHSLNMYCGRTTQHIPYVLQEWSKLLPVPVLEPNDMAKETVEILVKASQNRDKPFIQL